MANDLNQCMFIGHLGRDPETKYLPSGDAVCNFSIACNWKTKEKEGAEWVRIVVFGKLAEICGEYLVKGKQVFISGRMQTREWEKDGIKRFSTEVVADRMQMLGGRGNSADDDDEPEERQPDKTQQRAPAKSGGNFEHMEDDIPFAPIGRGISGHAL